MNTDEVLESLRAEAETSRAPPPPPEQVETKEVEEFIAHATLTRGDDGRDSDSSIEWAPSKEFAVASYTKPKRRTEPRLLSTFVRYQRTEAVGVIPFCIGNDGEIQVLLFKARPQSVWKYPQTRRPGDTPDQVVACHHFNQLCGIKDRFSLLDAVFDDGPELADDAEDRRGREAGEAAEYFDFLKSNLRTEKMGSSASTALSFTVDYGWNKNQSSSQNALNGDGAQHVSVSKTARYFVAQCHVRPVMSARSKAKAAKGGAAFKWFSLDKCQALLKTPSRRRVLDRLIRITDRYRIMLEQQAQEPAEEAAGDTGPSSTVNDTTHASGPPPAAPPSAEHPNATPPTSAGQPDADSQAVA